MEGRVENPFGRFALTLPPGVRALWEGPPAPFHGFTVFLEQDRRRKIHAQVYPVTMESEQRLDSLADLLLRLVRLDDRRARVVLREPSSLGGRPALRQVIAFRRTRRRIPTLEDQILVHGDCLGDPPRCRTFYTFVLETPRAHHPRDGAFFLKLTKAWEFLPDPPPTEPPRPPEP